jgi:hypothetical protein
VCLGVELGVVEDSGADAGDVFLHEHRVGAGRHRCAGEDPHRRAVRCGGSGGFFFDHPWLGKVGDHHIGRVGGFDTCGQFEFADVQGIADLQMRDIGGKGVRKVVGHAANFQRVNGVLEQAAAVFHSDRLAFEMKRHVSSDLGVFINGAEVRMNRSTGERVMLHILQESQRIAQAFDVEVDQDVFRAAVGEKIVEAAGIDLEVFVGFAQSVHDRRQPAFFAHLVESSGTSAVAEGGFEICFLGHGRRAGSGYGRAKIPRAGRRM